MATTRRTALKGGLSALGAVAMAATGKPATAAGLSATDDVPRGDTLVLHGRQWRITSQDLRRGQPPPVGVRMLTRGEIVDAPVRGRKVGDFFATYYRLSDAGKVAAHEPGSLELHTFVFPDGTIVGSGVAGASLESEGHFAITGGTGRYLGARGAYVARQSFLELGGDGTATFTLTLV